MVCPGSMIYTLSDAYFNSSSIVASRTVTAATNDRKNEMFAAAPGAA